MITCPKYIIYTTYYYPLDYVDLCVILIIFLMFIRPNVIFIVETIGGDSERGPETSGRVAPGNFNVRRLESYSDTHSISPYASRRMIL